MKKNKYIVTFFFVMFGISFSQDVFEGYTLFTPQFGTGGSANTYLMDMEDIQNIAPDYLSDLQPVIDKCEDIIHEELNRFVSDNRRRRELHISHSYI